MFPKGKVKIREKPNPKSILKFFFIVFISQRAYFGKLELLKDELL